MHCSDVCRAFQVEVLSICSTTGINNVHIFIQYPWNHIKNHDKCLHIHVTTTVAVGKIATDAWLWLSPGEAWAKCLLYFTNPHPAEGSVTLRSKSHHQSAYPLSLALVLIYVSWHAISCSITFTCQTVYQGGSMVMGGNSIRITFCPQNRISTWRWWQWMSKGRHTRYLTVLSSQPCECLCITSERVAS